MADTVVETAGYTDLQIVHGVWGRYWADNLIGACIFINTNQDVAARRTIDGGVSEEAQDVLEAGTVWDLACWYDKETVGNTGTVIHIVYCDSADDEFKYTTYDVAAGAFGSIVTIQTAAGFFGLTAFQSCYIQQTRNGNLLAGYTSAATSGGYRSTDGGATFGSRANPFEAHEPDWVQSITANTGDDADGGIFFWDRSANAISIKMYDNSANSWTETAIASSFTDTDFTKQYDVAIRISDGKAVISAWSTLDAAGADLQAWLITPTAIDLTGLITALTDVLTNTAEAASVAVFIDPLTDDIYVDYTIGSDWSTGLVSGVYKKSTDDGATWDAQAAYTENAETSLRYIASGAMGVTGGRYQPIVFDSSSSGSTPKDLLINLTNDIDLPASSPPPPDEGGGGTGGGGDPGPGGGGTGTGDPPNPGGGAGGTPPGGEVGGGGSGDVPGTIQTPTGFSGSGSGYTTEVRNSKNLALIAELTGITTWNYRRRDVDMGEFMITVPRTLVSNEAVARNNIVLFWRNGRIDFVGIIRKRRLINPGWLDTSELWELSGPDLKWFLEGRVVDPRPLEGDLIDAVPAETAIKYYVAKHMLAAGRSINDELVPPLLFGIEPNGGRGDTVSFHGRWQKLLTGCVVQLARAGQLWHSVDLVASGYEYRTNQYRDLTSGPFKVVFSLGWGDLAHLDYAEDFIGTANAVYVLGDGTGVARAVTEATDAANISLDFRRERTLDSRQSDTEAERLSAGTAEVKRSIDESLTVTIDPLIVSQVRYWDDFDLGDIVAVEIPEIGYSDSKRIVEVGVFVDQAGVERIEVSLGSRKPEFAKKIADDLRRTLATSLE